MREGYCTGDTVSGLIQIIEKLGVGKTVKIPRNATTEELFAGSSQLTLKTETKCASDSSPVDAAHGKDGDVRKFNQMFGSFRNLSNLHDSAGAW